MARLSLTILKNKPNKDGSFNIKISISAQSKTVYIPTRFSVNSGKEWRHGRVVKRFDADLLNRKLARMLMEYEDILAENPMADFLSASATRDYLLRKANNTDLIRDSGNNPLGTGGMGKIPVRQRKFRNHCQHPDDSSQSPAQLRSKR